MTTPQSYYFLGKNNSPQWILIPCFKTTFHELLKSTLKKHDYGTKLGYLRCACWAKNVLLLVPENSKTNVTFYKKRIYKCDWTNLTRKNINIHVYTIIGKLPSLVFFPKFASFSSLSQTESASLPSLINWVQCHIFNFYYCYSGIM